MMLFSVGEQDTRAVVIRGSSSWRWDDVGTRAWVVAAGKNRADY